MDRRAMIPLTRYISGLWLGKQGAIAPIAVMSFPQLNRFGDAAGRRRQVAHRKVALEPHPPSNRHIGRPARWFDKLDRAPALVGMPRASRPPLPSVWPLPNPQKLPILVPPPLQTLP